MKRFPFRPSLIRTAGLLACALLFELPAPAARFELSALRYARSRYREDWLHEGGDRSRWVDFAWMFYLARFESKIILFDTGFDPAQQKRRIRDFHIEWIHPLRLLEKLSVAPETVTDVVVTHSHYDHVGNLRRFPNARIVIHEKALETLLEPGPHQLIARYLRNHPRIETFRTDFELYGKFHVRWIGGHTKGSSAVFFRHAGEAFVLTGDEVFFRENVAASRLSGEIVDRRRNRSFLRELNRIPALRILTFHDPGIVPAEQEWIRIT